MKFIFYNESKIVFLLRFKFYFSWNKYHFHQNKFTTKKKVHFNWIFYVSNASLVKWHELIKSEVEVRSKKEKRREWQLVHELHHIEQRKRRKKSTNLLMTGRFISRPTSWRSLIPSMSGISTSVITISNLFLFSCNILSASLAWFVVVTVHKTHTILTKSHVLKITSNKGKEMHTVPLYWHFLRRLSINFRQVTSSSTTRTLNPTGKRSFCKLIFKALKLRDRTTHCFVFVTESVAKQKQGIWYL